MAVLTAPEATDRTFELVAEQGASPDDFTARDDLDAVRARAADR